MDILYDRDFFILWLEIVGLVFEGSFFGCFYGKLILYCVICVMYNIFEVGVNGLMRGGFEFLW